MKNASAWEVQTSWDHMVMDQSRSTQHQVRPWQKFSVDKSKWQTNYMMQMKKLIIHHKSFVACSKKKKS
jgi:hypothetical protein